MRATKLWSVLSLAGAIAVGGCSSMQRTIKGEGEPETVALEVTPRQPAAMGHVKVTPQKGGNQKVEVRVEHLASPERVAPDARAYVVWLIPRERQAKPQNVGMLKLDENLNGKLETETPYRQFDVHITAESDPHVTEPSHTAVMRASVELPSTAIK